MKKIIWSLFIALVIYNFVDVYQTKLLLDLGAIEANPILSWLMNVTGTWKVIAYYKTFLLTSLGTLLFVYLKNK